MPVLMRAAFLASALLFTYGAASAAPVSLAAALDKGAETSPRIAQARAQLEAAEARARQAGVGPNPDLGLTVENFGGTGPYRAFRSTETTLEVSQRFELGGKRSARRAVAGAERDVDNRPPSRTGRSCPRYPRSSCRVAGCRRARRACRRQCQSRPRTGSHNRLAGRQWPRPAAQQAACRCDPCRSDGRSIADVWWLPFGTAHFGGAYGNRR